MTQSYLFLSLLALLSCCVSTTTAEETITLSLPVWRLELTIKIQEPFRRNLYGNLRRGLSPFSPQLESAGLQISGKGESNNRKLQTTTSDKIDGAIQSTAELHLKNIYAEQFNMEPTQVLLTVVTNTPSNTSSQTNNNNSQNIDEELIEYEEVSTNGIYVRSSFLGGVVTFNNEEISLPTRSELQSVTLDAFSIPGKGEIFLQSLKEYSPTITQLNPGLLLISASEVKRNDVADSNAADIATTNSNIYEGSAPAITPANTNNNNNGGDMNIWAVAAVAALGAMFIVIVTCTSILYCDWRKRKERKERRRERAFMMQQQQQQQGGMMGAVYNNGGGSNYARSNDGKKNSNKNYTNMEIDGEQQQQLQIVVPHASSGDTEEYDGISPSTQGSNNNNINNSNALGRDGMMMESKKGSLLGNIVNKSRRSLIKSKAAKEQLQEANAASIPSSQPLSAQGEYQPNDYNNNNMNNMNNNNPAADMSVTDCGYSVGEDTTMLYPTINRNRTNSKDNMSDWDGYSMDGMSAIGDGGVSQYGGSGKGGGGGSGVHSKNKGGESRDMYYSGDVPRDFDSVWGDDESKLTMDGTDVNSVDYDNGAARAALMAAADGDSISDYMPPAAVVATAASRNNNADLADLTQNLNQLVDQELGVTDVESVERSNTASTSSAGKLDEFIDSDSASGSGHNFTLELLGKKSKSKLTKGTSAGSSSVTPSVDDDDSILGDLYKDDTMSELGGGLGGDDISAIEGVAEEEGDDDDEEGAADGKNASSGDSVDSTPSWAEKIQSAVGNSAVVSNIFRTSSKGMLDNDEEDKMDTPAPSKDEEDDEGESSSSSQAQRIKNKFMSGLISDDSSVGSSRSNRSRNSTSSRGSRGSHKSSSSRKANTAKSSSEKALGLTNSMDEEVDEDPAAMIDNINSMLSECRDILDTEKDTTGEP